MAISITHRTVATVPDWTQAVLDSIKAGNPPPLPPADTSIDGVILPQRDWNDTHVIDATGVTDGYVITASGGVADWAPPSGGGGSVASVSNSDGSLTISPTTGAVVASLNTAHSNVWTAQQDFRSDPIWLRRDKSLAFEDADLINIGAGAAFGPLTLKWDSAVGRITLIDVGSNLQTLAVNIAGATTVSAITLQGNNVFGDTADINNIVYGTRIYLADPNYAANGVGNFNTNGDYLIDGTFIPVSHWTDDGYYNLAIQFQDEGTNIDSAGFFETVNFTGSGVTASNVSGVLTVNIPGGGGGGGAPTGAEYVVLSLNGSLTHERVLTAGTGISITDAGAGSTVTIASTITQYTDELAQDAVGTILTDSSEIDFTYDDATPSITAVLKNGIAATRLADGSVSNTEFQYLGNVTSDIQTQLDSKISIAQARLLTFMGI